MREFKVIFSLALILTMLAPLIFFEISTIKFASIYAQTNGQCTEQLNTAEEKYQARKWSEAIDLIDQCLMKSNLSVVERGKAYRILSLVYIAMQSEKKANDAVKNMLKMIPNYKIEPDRDSPLLQKMIDDMAQTLTPEITIITPNSRRLQEDGFIMTVKGLNFSYGSEVRINGTGKSTTFISDMILQAKIPASDLLKEDEYEITVYSPISNGRTSNVERFVVGAPSMSLGKWFALGSATIAIVVATIFLLKPYPDDTTIADPPERP
jgi:hypothetical protein